MVKKCGLRKFTTKSMYKAINEVVNKISKVAILGALNIHLKALTFTTSNRMDLLTEMFSSKFNPDGYFREVHLEG